MTKHVQTGCPNCKRCTNSAVGEGGRKAGRAMAALMTAGMSEGARLATANCRACGHKMSLHAKASAAAPAGPTLRSFIADRLEARSERESAVLSGPTTLPTETLERGLADFTREAEKYEGEAAKSEARGKERAADKARGLATLRREAASRYAAELERRRQGTSQPPATPAASTSAPTPPSEDITNQLARLADLKAAGVLSDDEFAAAKSRLLG